LGLVTHDADIDQWKAMIHRIKSAKEEFKVAVVGKYIELQDAYKSIYESLQHGAAHHGIKLKIIRIDSEVSHASELEKALHEVDGILIPGGFGARGIEGKVHAANYARLNNKPFFGICLGMQVAMIAFAREVCGLPEANSTEFN